MITELIRNGELQDHIAKVLIPAYAHRWEKMMDAISRFLVPLGVRLSRMSLAGMEISGGYFIWLQLPERLLAEDVANVAKQREQLTIAHGNMFEVYGDEEAVKFDSGVRLCFSWEDEDKLVEGVERLGKVIKDMLDGNARAEKDDSNGMDDSREPIGEY
jgi:DNA-binding transcriptional MocR family regulator